jgi:hypothetical protein
VTSEVTAPVEVGLVSLFQDWQCTLLNINPLSALSVEYRIRISVPASATNGDGDGDDADASGRADWLARVVSDLLALERGTEHTIRTKYRTRLPPAANEPRKRAEQLRTCV